MNERQRAACHDQAAIAGTRKGRDAALDLRRVAHVDRAHLHPERRRRGTDRAPLADPGGYCGIPKDRNSRYARRDLLEQLQPFRAQAVIEQDKASGVAARPRQTIDIAGADGIGDAHEHDRHGACCLKQRNQGWRAKSQDDVGRKRDQFRRVFANLVGIPRGPAIVNLHVSAVGPTQLLQRLQERSDVGLRAWIVRVAAALKHADAPHLFRLLRACWERPSSRCTAEKGDELAPSHRRPEVKTGHRNDLNWDIGRAQ